jgi:hypothetical protein
VATDDLPGRAFDLASAVGVDGQRPAHLVQHHVMMPETVVFKPSQAGSAAVGPVHHMMRLAGRGRLVAAARILTRLITQCDQPAQVDGDVVGLADVQRKRRAAQAFLGSTRRRGRPDRGAKRGGQV